MRVVLIPAVLLAACATTAETESSAATAAAAYDATATADRLAPQRLRDGECGLFGWNLEQRFVFFAAEDRARYLGQGGPVDLTPRGEFPATDYGPVSLRLGPPEALIEGQRYARARVTETLPDGFTRVVPLVIVETCKAVVPAL